MLASSLFLKIAVCPSLQMNRNTVKTPTKLNFSSLLVAYPVKHRNCHLLCGQTWASSSKWTDTRRCGKVPQLFRCADNGVSLSQKPASSNHWEINNITAQICCTFTMTSSVPPLLRSAIGGVAFGGLLYLVGDTASDYLTFSRLRAAAVDLADQDEELKQLVGLPYTTGFWYNSTLGFSHREKVAHCTFQLQGSRRVTDIAVKGGRQQGFKSNVLYNILGPGTWNLLSCQAMVPSEGGLVEARSLIPQHREEREQQQQQLLLKHQQHQQPQLQQQHAAGSSKSWWPWRRGSSSSSSSAAAAGVQQQQS